MLTHGIRALLLGQASITAIAPAQKVGRITFPAVFCDDPAQGVKPPFVVIHQMSVDPLLTLDAYDESLKQTEVEIDCYGTSQDVARLLSLAVRQFLDDFSGPVPVPGEVLDTIKAVIWEDETYDYDNPNNGGDQKYHFVTDSYVIQHTLGE